MGSKLEAIAAGRVIRIDRDDLVFSVFARRKPLTAALFWFGLNFSLLVLLDAARGRPPEVAEDAVAAGTFALTAILAQLWHAKTTLEAARWLPPIDVASKLLE